MERRSHCGLESYNPRTSLHLKGHYHGKVGDGVGLMDHSMESFSQHLLEKNIFSAITRPLVNFCDVLKGSVESDAPPDVPLRCISSAMTEGLEEVLVLNLSINLMPL